MALKDIFTMIKADRYTADGKDELNKALEADVKDKTYQVGEISQKTGLQKQGDGSWAPPKNGKQLGAKKPAESKPNTASGIPNFKGMASEDYDKKLRSEGWITGGWEGNGSHASAVFKKGDRTIRVDEGQPGKITSVQEIGKPASDSAPRALTGDCKVRVKK